MQFLVYMQIYTYSFCIQKTTYEYNYKHKYVYSFGILEK